MAGDIHISNAGLWSVIPDTIFLNLKEFVEHGMGDLLARSDIVITRAGMGILGELSVLAKDALVIPMAGTHQEINMDALVKKGSVFQADPDLF